MILGNNAQGIFLLYEWKSDDDLHRVQALLEGLKQTKESGNDKGVDPCLMADVVKSTLKR